MFHHTDQGACEIHGSFVVDPGHFGGFATEECTTILLTGRRHRCHDFGHILGHKARGRNIIEEEQWLGALYEHIIDAVVDEIVTNASEAAGLKGEFYLGTHPIGGGHQHRMVHLRETLG